MVAADELGRVSVIPVKGLRLLLAGDVLAAE